MKKGLRVLFIIIAVIIFLGVFAYVGGTQNMDEVKDYVLPDIDMKTIEDGEYEGSCDIGRFAIAVAVTVKDHKIVDVAFVEDKMSNVTDDLFKKMNERFINKDHPSFDAMTGASITSKAYMIAVTDALNK
ncbi:MAG: FMN-binding protein [Candidatus Marinimicrobia bacterium]|nr:FMN-binding protein [Candidatus Neomarinimicrobiota bacterium]